VSETRRESTNSEGDGWAWRDRVGAWPQAARAGSTFVFGAVLYPLARRLLPGGDDRYGALIEAAIAGIFLGAMWAVLSEVFSRREFGSATAGRSVRCNHGRELIDGPRYELGGLEIGPSSRCRRRPRFTP